MRGGRRRCLTGCGIGVGCILRRVRIAEPGERPPFQVTILSPHRDDAAFSCGLLLSRCAELGVPVRIVNVFTRSAYAPYLAGGAGADEVETVSAARLAEDRALVERMGAGCRMDDVGLTDAPVRVGLRVDRVMAEPLRLSIDVRVQAAMRDGGAAHAGADADGCGDAGGVAASAARWA